MIAREASRDVRGVREHIEKARLERDFEAALREQLRDALRSHQQDMMDFLGHLRLAVHTPELTSASGTGMEFGLEDLWQPAELAQHREMGLGPTL